MGQTFTLTRTLSHPFRAARLICLGNAVGQRRKEAVAAAATPNLAGPCAASALVGPGTGALTSIGGVSLAAGDRLLPIGQEDKNQNGIYAAAGLGDGAAVAWALARALTLTCPGTLS
jgi:hypothetical protein